jgi:hypothetical protein
MAVTAIKIVTVAKVTGLKTARVSIVVMIKST